MSDAEKRAQRAQLWERAIALIEKRAAPPDPEEDPDES